MKWLEIIKVGNDGLREVYETVWSKSILTAEQDGIRQYKNAVAKVRATLPPGNPKQGHTELIPLYQEAARNKPAYDKTMCMLQKLFRDKTGVELGMSLCPTLKTVSRIPPSFGCVPELSPPCCSARKTEQTPPMPEAVSA